MGNNAPILEVRDLLKTFGAVVAAKDINCLLYTSPSPRDLGKSRMPSSA